MPDYIPKVMQQNSSYRQRAGLVLAGGMQFFGKEIEEITAAFGSAWNKVLGISVSIGDVLGVLQKIYGNGLTKAGHEATIQPLQGTKREVGVQNGAYTKALPDFNTMEMERVVNNIKARQAAERGAWAAKLEAQKADMEKTVSV
jgi:hypothetical protein